MNSQDWANHQGKGLNHNASTGLFCYNYGVGITGVTNRTVIHTQMVQSLSSCGASSMVDRICSGYILD